MRAAAGLAPLLMLIALSTPAYAYVGPGAGVSLFGAAIGLIVALGSALGVLLMWPIRAAARAIHRLRTKEMQGQGLEQRG